MCRTGEQEALGLLHGLENLTELPLIAVLTANCIKSLDPALLRPGRVDEVREVPEPNAESRRVILDHYARRYELAVSPHQVESFLQRSEGFSPADVREFAETARAMGVATALEEVQRISEHRELYAGSRCEEFSVHRNAYPAAPRRRLRRRA